MTLHFIFLFSITVFFASIIPGPSMLLALTHGIQYGPKKTIASALGNVTITLIQASISITGLGTILVASESIFYIIKCAGAVYLVYIGMRILFSSSMLVEPYHSDQPDKIRTMRKLYLQAALVTAGNPKAIVFFTAIFPQFINPDSAYMFQSCILIGLCAIIAFGCFMVYAICGQKVVSFFSKGIIGKYVPKIVGSTFIGAGIGLATGNK